MGLSPIAHRLLPDVDFGWGKESAINQARLTQPGQYDFRWIFSQPRPCWSGIPSPRSATTTRTPAHHGPRSAWLRAARAGNMSHRRDAGAALSK